jgi:CRP/FNR family transcriptional regulator, cyclic AMP receptor protein
MSIGPVSSRLPSSRHATPVELREIGLFGALSDAVLEHLSDTLEVVEVPAGTMLFREGDLGEAMYVVLQGDIEVQKGSRHGEHVRVAVLGPRDWFGEMSIIDVQRRSATVTAASPATLIRVTPMDLDRLYRVDVKAYALIVLNIAREMSRRLRVADGMMAEMIANMDSWVKKRTGTGSSA